MDSNSIRDNLSKDDIISDIRLCLGADVQGEKIYLLVEGEDDIKFLRPFVTNNVYIYESYDGKNGVEFIINQYFLNNNQVIGIRDRDYQMNPVSKKIFYYDCGCMEMMLIRNDGVFKNLCAEYYSGNESFQQLRINILEGLKYLSIIRMYNEREGWGQKIRGVSICSAWSIIKSKIDEKSIIKKLNEINQGFFAGNVLNKIEKEYDRQWSAEEFYNNTQGHDFTTLYATICSQYRKKKSVKYTEIEASSRCTFRVDDFRQTQLYNRLRNYEQKYHIRICNPIG